MSLISLFSKFLVSCPCLVHSGTTICVRHLNDSSRKIEKITLEGAEYAPRQEIQIGRNGTVIAVFDFEAKLFKLYDVRSKKLISDDKWDNNEFLSMCTSEDELFILMEMESGSLKVRSLRKADNGGVPSVENYWELDTDDDRLFAYPRLREINGIPYIQFVTKERNLKLYRFDETDNSWNLV